MWDWTPLIVSAIKNTKHKHLMKSISKKLIKPRRKQEISNNIVQQFISADVNRFDRLASDSKACKGAI